MSETLNQSDAVFLDRMLDYSNGVHSLPESCAVEDEDMDQAGVYGPQWDRAVCGCGLYPYDHAGCPGPAAQHLPVGWQSGDAPQ